MGYVETPQEFADKHPGPAVKINNCIVYGDGALVDLMPGMAAIFREPPTDPRQNLAFRRQYHERFLELVETAFKALKHVILRERLGPGWWEGHWNSDLFGPMSTDPKEVLAHLAALGKKQKAAIAEIDAGIAKLPEEVAAKKALAAMAKERAERERKTRQALEELNAITI